MDAPDDREDNPDPEPPAPIEIYPLLRWTIPIHALLPVGIAALGREHEVLISWLWIAIHLGFPVFLAASYPWWRGRGDDVAYVVIINHAVTFAVGIALITWW